MIGNPRVGDRVILVDTIDVGGDIAGVVGETGTVEALHTVKNMVYVRFDETNPYRSFDGGHSINVYYHELDYLSDYEINVSLEVDELI